MAVVTACYKSAPFIERVFESLRRQTAPPAEWIAVIDGRFDETEVLIRAFAEKVSFPVRVRVFEENRGARAAIAEGIRMAQSDFVLILDHDDELTADALEVMLNAWRHYPGDRSQLSGVGARCVDPVTQQPIGSAFPESPCVTNELELRHKLHVTGELTGIVRTDILQKYYLGSNAFVTNGLVWRRIAKDFRAIYLNAAVRVYHRDNPGSMTLGGVVTFPAEQLEQIVTDLNLTGDYFRFDRTYFLRQLWHLNRLARHLRLPAAHVAQRLIFPVIRTAFLALALLAPLQVLRDRRKGITVSSPGPTRA